MPDLAVTARDVLAAAVDVIADPARFALEGRADAYTAAGRPVSVEHRDRDRYTVSGAIERAGRDLDAHRLTRRAAQDHAAHAAALLGCAGPFSSGRFAVSSHAAALDVLRAAIRSLSDVDTYRALHEGLDAAAAVWRARAESTGLLFDLARAGELAADAEAALTATIEALAAQALAAIRTAPDFAAPA